MRLLGSAGRRRRGVGGMAAVSAAAVGLAVVVVAPTATAAPPPAKASPPTTVTSGQARFEVLSPTLVRTEFAGDSRFVDAPTINAIGRDAFSRTPVRTTKKVGWV